MLTLFSLLYGPLVVFMMDAFSDRVSSFIILVISVILIAMHYKEKSPAWIIPFVYLIISVITLALGKGIWLKFGPLTISVGVAVLLSMKNKTPIMIKNTINNWKKLREKNFSYEQIRSNTWIWTVAAWFNVVLHVMFLAFAKNWLWAIYVSVGWYGVFGLAGVIHLYIWQHRRRKRKKEEG
ncbi:MAG: hypothetical protein ACK5LP_01085 [Campylobacteraceae bacterium]